MPSKNYNGNARPAGEPIKLQGASGLQGAIGGLENKMAKLQPAQSLSTGSAQLPNGRMHIPKRARARAASASCILGNMSFDTENSTASLPKYKLKVGFISGGGDTESVEPDNLTATIDDYVWIAVAWTADVTDGVVLPGGTMGAVTFAQGATVPSDTVPTPSSAAGIAHMTLGRWLGDGAVSPATPAPVWHGQGCGSIQLYFCPSGFFFGRGNVLTA